MINGMHPEADCYSTSSNSFVLVLQKTMLIITGIIMKIAQKIIYCLVFITFLSGCGAVSAPKPTETTFPSVTNTPIPPTVTPTITPSPIPPTATPIRTPPALPVIFQTNILNPLDTPHAYVSDTCQYLKARWDPNNSGPGTVVMIVMLHGVSKSDETPKDPKDISHSTFKKIAAHAAEVGFKTITTEQLANFLESNAKIPSRSIMFLVDDRHSREYYDDHFVPFLKKYEWNTVTNAWITFDDSIGAQVAPQMQELVKEGVLDVQSHGYIHNVNITNGSTDDFINNELNKSKEIITNLFGKAPIAYIWPGGSFTLRGAQLARQDGYRLGFTINPRGPIMYNWVPLTDKKDPARPSYLPEGEINDPLMVLPRYWSYDALYKIDEVINIGDSAATIARQNKDTELLYYDIVCKDKYGSIPSTTP
jgi:peptidoglycan/xylan/chitin deacetylase (PgdA/CDA1 family)